MAHATPNEQIPLEALITDGNTDLFGEARVYDANSNLVAVLDLTYQTDGLYRATWTPTDEGYYTVIYSFFYDNLKTISADDEYPKAGEQINVTSEKTNIMRILGLLHENAVLDQTIYTAEGVLTGGRLRVYDSKANALLAGSTGLIYEYKITADISAGLTQKYSITREL